MTSSKWSFKKSAKRRRRIRSSLNKTKMNSGTRYPHWRLNLWICKGSWQVWSKSGPYCSNKSLHWRQNYRSKLKICREVRSSSSRKGPRTKHSRVKSRAKCPKEKTSRSSWSKARRKPTTCLRKYNWNLKRKNEELSSRKTEFNNLQAKLFDL